MRKIKFRGKNTKGEWVFGSLIVNEIENDKGKFKVAFIVPGLPCASDGGDYYTTKMERVKIDTIGQFIDIKDNCDKDIYEGDVFRRNRNTYRIEYWNGLWVGVDADGGWVPLLEDNDWVTVRLRDKVIGNIYDNPEILK